jgi:hypothetical protein
MNLVLLHPEVGDRHYVLHSARHPRRWVAFSPNKVNQYQENFGDDFCLVITGDPSEPNDFYALPWKMLKSYFVRDNLYPGPQKNGKVSLRWQIHLEGPPHHFQMELAPTDIRERPRFDATPWYGNSELLNILKDAKLEANEHNDTDEDFTAVEGREIMELHRRRERDPSIARRKKLAALKINGRLACEVCDFDFSQSYGALGEGFIEAHHTVPLRDLARMTRTSARDLSLVCSNCHRMLHRGSRWVTISELKLIFNSSATVR